MTLFFLLLIMEVSQAFSWNKLVFSLPMTAYEDKLLTKQQHLKQKLNVDIFLYKN